MKQVDLNKISRDFLNFIFEKYNPLCEETEVVKFENIENTNKVKVFASGYYHWMKRDLGVEDLPKEFQRNVVTLDKDTFEKYNQTDCMGNVFSDADEGL